MLRSKQLLAIFVFSMFVAAKSFFAAYLWDLSFDATKCKKIVSFQLLSIDEASVQFKPFCHAFKYTIVQWLTLRWIQELAESELQFKNHLLDFLLVILASNVSGFCFIPVESHENNTVFWDGILTDPSDMIYSKNLFVLDSFKRVVRG
jgi:hypothetical protein